MYFQKTQRTTLPFEHQIIVSQSLAEVKELHILDFVVKV